MLQVVLNCFWKRLYSCILCKNTFQITRNVCSKLVQNRGVRTSYMQLFCNLFPRATLSEFFMCNSFCKSFRNCFCNSFSSCNSFFVFATPLQLFLSASPCSKHSNFFLEIFLTFVEHLSTKHFPTFLFLK